MSVGAGMAAKDIMLVVSFVFSTLGLSGVIGILLAYRKAILEHPGYTAVLEREFQIYDKINEIDSKLTSGLTSQSTEVTCESAQLDELRNEIKSLAANVFCPDALATSLFSLNSYIRDSLSSEAGGIVTMEADTLLGLWRACKNHGRKRIRDFQTPDEPYALYLEEGGKHKFVNRFKTKRERRQYIRRNPSTGSYIYWADGEKPGLVRRMFRK